MAASQEQLETHIGKWIKVTAGIPFVRSEQTDGNGSAPPHPSAANIGSDTWSVISTLDGPRMIGRAQLRKTTDAGVQERKSQRAVIFSVKIQGPRAVDRMEAALQSLEDGSSDGPLNHPILGPFVFRKAEGPRHLQSQLETGYLKVSQADLTFVFQETWSATPGILERIEGSVTVQAPGDTLTIPIEAE